MMNGADILIFAAVREEIAWLSSCLTDVGTDSIGGMDILSGILADQKVRLFNSGPGAVNTARALTACIETRRPRLLIQTGCAGAYGPAGLDIGDIGVATEEIDAQLGVEDMERHFPVLPLPFPLLEGVQSPFPNRFPLDPELAERAYAILADAFDGAASVCACPFITVSTITACQTTAALLYLAHRGGMEAMEGAAAAQIAIFYDLPLLEIRSASNMAGHRDKSLWNLPLAFQRCGKAVYTLLKTDPFEDI